MMRKFLAALALAVLALFAWMELSPPPAGIPILEYHMVSEQPWRGAEDYCVPPEDFRQQMDWLASEGYTTITLLEFMKAKRGKMELPEKPIVLTFDDGYESNYLELLPILEERGMRAMVYMVTNRIGQPGYLSWDELRDMQGRGIEIGSHTANHLPMTELSPGEQADEMRLSKLIMEWNGINTVFSFSYPNGKYSESMPELLRENEYLTAVTGDAGLNTFRTNPYLLQRVNIPRPRFGLLEFRFRLKKAEWMTRLGIMQHRETEEQ